MASPTLTTTRTITPTVALTMTRTTTATVTLAPASKPSAILARSATPSTTTRATATSTKTALPSATNTRLATRTPTLTSNVKPTAPIIPTVTLFAKNTPYPVKSSGKILLASTPNVLVGDATMESYVDYNPPGIAEAFPWVPKQEDLRFGQYYNIYLGGILNQDSKIVQSTTIGVCASNFCR